MSVDEPVDTSLINESLQKVAKGAGLVFLGSTFSILLAFVIRVLIARNYSQEEYGIFSLGFTILSMAAIVGSLGLIDGAARQISYSIGKKKGKNIVGYIIKYSLILGCMAGIMMAAVIYSFSNIVAVNFFHTPDLVYPLKIFSIAIPFFVLIHVLTGIFRGFGKIQEKVIFSDILRNLIFLLLVIIVVNFTLPFNCVILASSISIILACVIFIIYFALYIPPSLKHESGFNPKVGKQLLLFSLPLMLVAFLHFIMDWTDTLMLGRFRDVSTVGLYNAALPMGKFMSMGLASTLFIYLPVVSNLYASDNKEEIKKSYIVITKWLCAYTLPLALVFLLYSKAIMGYIFGNEYVLAATVLQILSIGYFINTLLGPNGVTLTAIGETKFLMVATFLSASLNASLNILLIPRYGIVGAAMASMVALISVNVIRSIKLYKVTKIHSFDVNILKPVGLSVILSMGIFFTINEALGNKNPSIFLLISIFLCFIAVYVLSVMLTKSYGTEDIELLRFIIKK